MNRPMKAAHLFALARPHQFGKNGILLLPLFFSEKLLDIPSIVATVSALIVFVLLTSAVYTLNDIKDVESDRLHPRKKNRPIAAGLVSVPQATVLFCVLITLSLALLAFLGFGWKTNLLFAVYLAINVGYSNGMKRIPIVEMFMVASGYVIRLMIGSLVIDRMPSEWILICTAAGALLMVAGKRREDVALENVSLNKLPFKEYTLSLLDQIVSVLSATTLVAYLLFTVSDYAHLRFPSPYLMVTTIFVGLGVFRYLAIIKNNLGAASPSIIIFKDRFLRYTLLAWTIIFSLLIY